MGSLTASLDALLLFLQQAGLRPPSWNVRILETGPSAPTDALGRISVKRDRLRTVAEYGPRFDALLDQGWPWLNVSCCGIDGDQMIVTVELPPSKSHSVRTSVNYSGPTQAVLEAAWSADVVIAFEGHSVID